MCGVDNDLRSEEAAGLAEEVASLRDLSVRLQAENARLLRLLELTPKQAAPPGPVQTGFFDAPPGPVDRRSPPEVKVDFFGQLFAARRDIYAVRWENARTGKAGWLPAVRGGWRKDARHEDRDYLPLTREVLRAHLSGETHIGLYPLLDGDLCRWLEADFDGQAAMLLRAPAAAHVHLGHAAVSAQLRRNRRWRSCPAARPGRHGRLPCRAGRQSP